MIIPAIASKWPGSVRDGATPTVFIQQDNAGPHIDVDDPEFTRAARAVTSVQIRLIKQPLMSPDLKICNSVLKSFDQDNVSSVTNLWLTLQCIYNEVLKSKGNNNYKLPHLRKEKLRKKGRLPENVTISNDALQLMMEHQNTLDRLDQQEKEVNEILDNAENIAGV